MDDAEQLMPNYMRFVRGVIDSNDLPLNVSREILQHSREIDAMRAGSVRKVLDLLEDLAASDEEKYMLFWRAFGRVLKEGVIEDAANRDRLAKLLRFASTHTDSESQTVSLADYVSRMKDGQSKIYYLTAESYGAARSSPHLEIFRKKGVDVLLLTDRVDEWVVSHMSEFGGKPLVSVAKGELDLGQLADKDEATAREQAENAFKDVLERIQNVLGDRVKAVRITDRLTESPSCLVADENDISTNFERLLKAAGQETPHVNPILEINPHHALVTRLKTETEESRLADVAWVLFDQAVLAEGGQLSDPAAFVRRVNALILGTS